MDFSKGIDWLTATRRTSAPDAALPYGFTRGDRNTKTPPHFDESYDLLPLGQMSIAHTAKKPDLLMLDWRGTDMTKLAAMLGGRGITELLCHCTDLDFNITRVDYRVDIFESENRPSEFLEMWRQKKAKTRVKWVTDQRLFTKAGGYSVYFGAPKSDRRLRIYDKAAEMKRLEQAWMRIELQTRKPLATPLVSAMVNHGTENAGDTAIKAFVDFPHHKTYQSALNGKYAPADKVPAKPDRWQHWLSSQVLDSIANHADNLDDNTFLQEWMMQVREVVYGAYKKMLHDDTLDLS